MKKFTDLGLMTRGYYLTNWQEYFAPMYEKMLSKYKNGYTEEGKKIDEHLYMTVEHLMEDIHFLDYTKEVI